MEHSPLSEAAKQLLLYAVGSLGRLEILLLMQRHANRWWTARELAAELRMPFDVVESHVGLLGSRNLISVRIAQDVLYRFGPGTQELEQQVHELVSAYYADRDAVAALVTSQGRDSARLFSDAFRIKRGKQDG